MSLTLFDIIVIAIVLISSVLAMVRGFVREILSVASWLLAALAAIYLHEPLRNVIQPYIENENLALIVSVAVIFIVVLVVVSYITMRVADYVIDSRIGGFDRLFGFLFGLVRGLLLVVVAFAFFVWLVEDQPEWIANAETKPLLTDLAERLAAVLPEDIEGDLLAKLRGESVPADLEPDPFEGRFDDAPAAEEEEPAPALNGDPVEQIIINRGGEDAGAGP